MLPDCLEALAKPRESSLVKIAATALQSGGLTLRIHVDQASMVWQILLKNHVGRVRESLSTVFWLQRICYTELCDMVVTREISTK